jgi:hypothetical protein
VSKTAEQRTNEQRAELSGCWSCVSTQFAGSPYSLFLLKGSIREKKHEGGRVRESERDLMILLIGAYPHVICTPLHVLNCAIGEERGCNG